MTLNEYQLHALSTAIYDKNMAVIYPTLGLTGEAGEVAEKVKKTLRDSSYGFNAERKKQIALELGDVLWYAAALANDLGYSLDDIAAMNINKIEARKNAGTVHGSGDNR